VPFSVAGTVYQFQSSTLPLANALVNLIDATGKAYQTGTNCAGNFFILPGTFTPQYPMGINVFFGGQTAKMNTDSFREGSCGACHADPASSTQVGHVFLLDDSNGPAPFKFPDAACDSVKL
jgi:hypothetical protein